MRESESKNHCLPLAIFKSGNMCFTALVNVSAAANGRLCSTNKSHIMASALMTSCWPSPRFVSKNFKQDGWNFFKDPLSLWQMDSTCLLQSFPPPCAQGKSMLQTVHRTNESSFHDRRKHDHLSWYCGRYRWIASIFLGGVNPDSSTRLLLIFPHTSKMAAGAVLTILSMSMHSRYSKRSNFLSRLCFCPLTVSILQFYSSLKCGEGKIRQ